MQTAFERRLAEFVDRKDEVKRFCSLLSGEEKAIMCIWGSGGVGKSQLVARMQHECSLQKVRKAEIVWTETRNHDYLAIMRKVRDDIGLEGFDPFTEMVNFYMDPNYKPVLKIEVQGNINVGNEMQIEGSTVGDVGAVVIKDSMIAIPRPDRAVPPAEIMAKLTDKFIDCLSTVSASGPLIVIFLDAAEKMTTETQQWIENELLRAIAHGRLRHVRVVLCGRTEPDFDRNLQFLTEEALLKPLELEHVEEYLEKRQIDEASRKELAKMLYATSKGNPLQIAQAVDAFLKL